MQPDSQRPNICARDQTCDSEESLKGIRHCAWRPCTPGQPPSPGSPALTRASHLALRPQPARFPKRQVLLVGVQTSLQNPCCPLTSRVEGKTSDTVRDFLSLFPSEQDVLKRIMVRERSPGFESGLCHQLTVTLGNVTSHL